MGITWLLLNALLNPVTDLREQAAAPDALGSFCRRCFCLWALVISLWSCWLRGFVSEDREMEWQGKFNELAPGFCETKGNEIEKGGTVFFH